jgi:ceramide glucosyltransferase
MVLHLGVGHRDWLVPAVSIKAFYKHLAELYRFKHFLRPTSQPWSPRLPIAQVPHVTILRPVDGREPLQRECLVSTFQQTYPAAKLTVYFCVARKSDPAYIRLRNLVAEFPAFDARVFVEEDDPNLQDSNGTTSNLGPNPKIRNMSAAYRAAKGDVLWIVDSNVWVSSNACGLLVDRLCGITDPKQPPARKFKFVHQLPLAADVSSHVPLLPGGTKGGGGAALDELFLATAHAKFYTAISTVAIAPCIVGKSNMFRRHHLDALTAPRAPGRSPGIDFFSDNICEDHLIGDLLWKRDVPVDVQQRAACEGQPPASSTAVKPSSSTPWGHHSLVLNPPCIQPLAHVSLPSYIARRARWLRVRKFTVPAATAVEPGTECLAATACLATAATNVPWLRNALGLADGGWSNWASVFALGVFAWGALDFVLWRMLRGWHGEGRLSGWESVRDVATRRTLALGGKAGGRNSFVWWLRAWAGRELLAGPVWVWAVLGGRTVQWRGRIFKVGMDATVREVAMGGDEKKKTK